MKIGYGKYAGRLETCLKMQKILRDEIDDPDFPEFAIEGFR